MASNSDEVVGTTYRHLVDAQDRITEVSDNWDAFAIANGAPDACLSSNVLGTKLWDHIHDWETVYLYKSLLSNIRETGKVISVPIRCDAPALKRFLEIRMEPLQEGFVAFGGRIVAVEPRRPVALIAGSVSRSDDLVRICSFCKQIDLGADRWVDTEMAVVMLGLFKKPVLPGLTHSICPACMAVCCAKDD